MNKLILARLAAVFTAGVLTACGVTGKSGKNEDFPETTTAEAEPVMMSAQAAKDYSALSAEKQGYGQGVQVDEKNRTTGALDFNRTYGKFNAIALNEDTDNITLTFDQGYENGYTSGILDTLKEKNVKAVFFLVQDYAERNPELVRRMIDEGHTVANHSVHHYSMPSLTPETARSEIMGMHEYMQKNFGVEMNLFRPPMGEFSEQSLAVTSDCGYRTMLWSFAYADWDTDDQPEPAESLEKLKNAAHPGAIYLLHSVSATNAKILPELIDSIRAEGFEFN
ncbi:polysaccharide deacetylase family protein [Ruminococcus albus]|uniref:Peptidoglycan-N-acetylmuramic acid deacetylase n=1 Tax=Ruminococcus albus TaxID=1264 RepID=A0A1I1J2C0_RUMAL|nr:polysaccharide deacetylase family protein [Ruminococcus albus]SFC42749.1 peptidoglycan-N-acetylmuramic acid deacetylase [Ruminococcus albus]